MRVKRYPWVISSRTCSRPLSTALMSTFLRQAFLPLREGCFDFAGAADISCAVSKWRKRYARRGAGLSWKVQKNSNPCSMLHADLAASEITQVAPSWA